MSSWRRKILWVGLPVLVVAFAANHAEWWYRQREARQREELAGSLSVRRETGLAGHRTIGIDENATLPAGPLFLRFATLGQWRFDPKSPSPCPAAVRALSGREVSCIGFMYPLEAGTRLKTFCLLRTTQTCCYGPRPQYNQYLLVEMKAPVPFERLTPVIVRGRFYPDAQPEQGFIYRLEGESVTPVTGDETEVNPADAAREAGAALFDFAPLGSMKDAASDAVPAPLRALDGTRVLVAGFLLNRAEGSPPRVLVGHDAWDGVSQGKPPTVYTAVMVFPADASEMPPVWKDRGAFTGVLRVEADPARWADAGIVSLRDARSCSADSGARRRAGPIVPAAYELLALAALLSLALVGRRNGRAPETPQEEKRP